MESTFNGFTRLMTDNDTNYFALLEASISSVDPYSHLHVIRTPTAYNFRISPSESRHINLIINQVNNLHHLLKIKLEYSKSIKSSKNISFSFVHTTDL